MGFLRQASAAVILVMLTLCFQCAGIGALIHWGRDHLARRTSQPSLSRTAVLLVEVMILMICLHILHILLWAWFYRWRCFPTWEVSFYFSATSYSTVGYGDVILPREWRTLGPIESISGVLMCGLSVSLLFAIMARILESEEKSASQSLL
jgi:voltage-gated potassium channel